MGAIKNPGFLIGLISSGLIISCSDPVPPPHALLPGQSNVITKLAPEATPQKALAAKPPDTVKPIGPEGFHDSFDRAELGPDWFNSGGPYRIQNGQLTHSLAHNHPLWLNRSLPREVQIDFDCTGLSPDGDVKVELFGDGRAAESDEDVIKDVQYTATGYVFIFGGWKNRLSTIVKQAEHAWERDKSVPRRNDVRVEPGRSYHWTITRSILANGSGHLDWKLDGQPFMAWDDPAPLDGAGHDRFAFEGWEAPAACSKLVIAPLKKQPAR